MGNSLNTAAAAVGRHAISSFVALGCVGFIASAPAYAQQAERPTRLEGVTVTDSAVEDEYRAEELSSPKATAPILDTPRIVNVITESVLEDTASFSLQEAFRTVPGITLGAGEGGTASADIPLIRGVDATGDVFIDGVRDIGSQTRELFAVQRIEIAKGPSTAFGGRGAAAGAINIVSKVARPGNFATGQVTVGTDDLVRVVGDVNASLSPEIAVRVVGMYHDSRVPGRNAVYDDRWGIAPSITYQAGDILTATLDYYHLETDVLPDFGIPLTSPGQLPGGIRRAADVDYDNFYGLLARDFQKTRADAATLHLRGDLGDGLVLTNTTRFSSTRNHYIVTNPDDSAGNVANGLVWRNTKSRNSENDGIGSNMNLAAVLDTGAIAHSLSLGFEFGVSDTVNVPYVVATGNRACLPADVASHNCTSLIAPNPADPWSGSISASTARASARAEEISLYLFDTITLSPALLLNGGIRWTDFSARGSGVSAGVPFAVTNAGDFWSWQGGVVFKPSETSSLYLSYANARTPPGSTVGEGSENLSPTNQLYEPQATENWEAGAKAELLGGGLLVSAALFRVERDNIQQRSPTGDVTEIVNAARLQGFEVGASGTAGPVSLLVGYTFVDSELRDGSANDGNALPQTPRHNVAATIAWQVMPRLSIGAGAYGASRRYADAANLISAGGYVTFDAHAEFDLNDHLGLRVNVNNITDERYIAKLRNPHFAVPGEGRQALVTLTARY